MMMTDDLCLTISARFVEGHVDTTHPNFTPKVILSNCSINPDIFGLSSGMRRMRWKTYVHHRYPQTLLSNHIGLVVSETHINMTNRDLNPNIIVHLLSPYPVSAESFLK